MELKDLINRAVEVRQKYIELEKKNGREWNTLERVQNFAGDVGELQKLAMAKAGLRLQKNNLDANLRSELADCLHSILIISEEYGIDLEQAFMETMSDLEKRTDKSL